MKPRFLFKRFIALYIDEFVIFGVLQLYIALLNVNAEHFTNLFPLFIAIAIVYFMILEFIFGRTIGKMLLRLSIKRYNKNNKKILLLQVISRNLMRLVPFDQISIFFYEDGRTWHDIVSKTYVEECTIVKRSV